MSLFEAVRELVGDDFNTLFPFLSHPTIKTFTTKAGHKAEIKLNVCGIWESNTPNFPYARMHLCGYLHLNKAMPDTEEQKFQVHGGIVLNNQEEKVVGFACAHGCDKSDLYLVCTPAEEEFWGKTTWKNTDFVTNELEQLSEQLKDKGY